MLITEQYIPGNKYRSTLKKKKKTATSSLFLTPDAFKTITPGKPSRSLPELGSQEMETLTACAVP